MSVAQQYRLSKTAAVRPIEEMYTGVCLNRRRFIYANNQAKTNCALHLCFIGFFC